MAKRIYLFIAVVVFSMLLMSSVASARSQFEASDSYVLSADNTVDDDLYVVGGTIQVGGTVNGDLIAAGQNISVTGDVRDDGIVAGGQLNLGGKVGQSIRAAGGYITITSQVGKDIIAAGGVINVNPAGEVSGKTLVTGGQIALNGKFNGDVSVSGGQVILKGEYLGNIKVESDDITIGPNTRISGDLIYTSANKAKINETAQITGKVEQKVPETAKAVEAGKAGAAAVTAASIASIILWGFIRKLVLFAMAFVVSLIFVYGFPKRTKMAMEIFVKSPWKSLGVGFLTLIVVPIGAIILMCTVVGLPIGLFALAVYPFMLFVTKIVVGISIGDLILNAKRSKPLHPLLSVLVGLAILFVLWLIPVFSFLVTILVWSFGLGALVLTKFTTLKEMDR
jgi:cytoskeletal protein CcmA (bactofilin family)